MALCYYVKLDIELNRLKSNFNVTFKSFELTENINFWMIFKETAVRAPNFFRREVPKKRI